MRFAVPVAGLFCLLSTPGVAGDLDLRLVDDSGQPIADAVVTVALPPEASRRPISFPWASVMTQQGIAFVPHVLVVPIGATVRFPNKDKVRHQVYSFSKPARFEIKLFGRDETRSYTFTTAGAVALGCNIHDQMTGFIKVVDTPFAAKSDVAGQVRITGVPAGAARVTIWYPGLRTRDNELAFVVPVPAAGPVQRTVRLATGRQH